MGNTPPRGLEARKRWRRPYPKIKVEVNKNVVVDDKVITSNGGSVSYQAALELLARLSSEKYAQDDPVRQTTRCVQVKAVVVKGGATF